MRRSSEEFLKLAAKKLGIQMVLESAKKTAANPFFRSKYADLNEVMSTIRDAMNTAGVYLLIEQYPTVDYQRGTGKTVSPRQGASFVECVPLVTITSRIVDVDSGEWEETDISAYPGEDTPQAIGSTNTYLRRYGIMPVFGITPEDDDGNSASGNNRYDYSSQYNQGYQKPANHKPQATKSPNNKTQGGNAAPVQEKPSSGNPPELTASEKLDTIMKSFPESEALLVDEFFVAKKWLKAGETVPDMDDNHIERAHSNLDTLKKLYNSWKLKKQNDAKKAEKAEAAK